MYIQTKYWYSNAEAYDNLKAFVNANKISNKEKIY